MPSNLSGHQEAKLYGRIQVCCATQNGSAIRLRLANASDPSGYTWKRSEPPTVSGATVSATFTPESPTAVVAVDVLQFMFEGEPECVLYNGIGGPDNATAIAASPFFVALRPRDSGAQKLFLGPLQLYTKSLYKHCVGPR